MTHNDTFSIPDVLLVGSNWRCCFWTNFRLFTFYVLGNSILFGGGALGEWYKRKESYKAITSEAVLNAKRRKFSSSTFNCQYSDEVSSVEKKKAPDICEGISYAARR